MNLLHLSDLTPSDVRTIWRLVDEPAMALSGTVAWSFEGDGIRTRTAFIQAFRELGLDFTELPNFLKTGERACDLAGYLDPFYAVYVVRESNHPRLVEFALASCRPVVSAMSSMGHPCEVLTDAYYVDRALLPIERARICLWGPQPMCCGHGTNLLVSWIFQCAMCVRRATTKSRPMWCSPRRSMRSRTSSSPMPGPAELNPLSAP